MVRFGCLHRLFHEAGDGVSAAQAVLPEVAAEPQLVAEILPWSGRSNVIATAGTLLLGLLERA